MTDAKVEEFSQPIFDYLSSLPVNQKPRLMILHNGRVLATFNEAPPWQAARDKVRENAWGTEAHAASTPRSSSVIWRPI